MNKRKNSMSKGVELQDIYRNYMLHSIASIGRPGRRSTQRQATEDLICHGKERKISKPMKEFKEGNDTGMYTVGQRCSGCYADYGFIIWVIQKSVRRLVHVPR